MNAPESQPDTLAAAFDQALRQVDRAQASGMRTVTGEPATGQLERLRADLREQREVARRQGRIDPDWLRGVVRWVVDWAPEPEIALIAALGAIARHRSADPAG